MNSIRERFHSELATYNESVTDISKNTWDFLLRRHPAYSAGVVVAAILVTIPFLYFGPLALMVLFGIPFFAYIGVKSHMTKLFFTQLASELGMQYKPHAKRNTVSGYFFDVGSGDRPRNVLIGTYRGVIIRLYEYQFTVNVGKHKATYKFIVSEINTQGKLPHVFVKPDGFGPFWKPSGTKLLSLEGNFNEHFDVYVAEDNAVNALRILEPDVMERLVNEFSVFGFECFETKTYVFKPGSFADSRDSLLAHLKLLERLYDELIPELRGVARSR